MKGKLSQSSSSFILHHHDILVHLHPPEHYTAIRLYHESSSPYPLTNDGAVRLQNRVPCQLSNGQEEVTDQETAHVIRLTPPVQGVMIRGHQEADDECSDQEDQRNDQSNGVDNVTIVLRKKRAVIDCIPWLSDDPHPTLTLGISFCSG